MIVSAGKLDKDQRVDIEKLQLPFPLLCHKKFGCYLMKTAYFFFFAFIRCSETKNEREKKNITLQFSLCVKVQFGCL